MKTTRSAQAKCLLILICAQAAFASPVADKFLQKLNCDGMCKPQGKGAVLGKTSYSCPDGFELTKDKLGIVQCIKRTPQDCPFGFSLGKDGQCCPPENACLPSEYGICPSTMVPRADCDPITLPVNVRKDIINRGLDFFADEKKGTEDIMNALNISKPTQEVLTTPAKGIQAVSKLASGLGLKNKTLPSVQLPSFKKDANSTVKATGLFSRMGRRLSQIGEALFAPAVSVEAERIMPLVVLPKPWLSFNVPEIKTKLDLPRIPRPRPPIVILPTPKLAFEEPKINVQMPTMPIYRPDMIVPILPTPKYSFIPPELKTQAGGLTIKNKIALIDATRMGVRKSYDINIPPIEMDIPHPVDIEVKPPPRTVVDLSRFGPRDTTVVKLPAININVSSPVEILRDRPRRTFVNVGGLQKGPVYDIYLPGLPDRNRVKVVLPKVNMSTVVLPGHTEKEVVAINLDKPKFPQSHSAWITVDARNASLEKLPQIVKLNESSLPADTRVAIVSLPPINVPRIPPLVTVDLRTNKSYGPVGTRTVPDLDVVQVKLPIIPRFGRDVNVSMGTVNIDRYLPARAPGDTGALNTTVTIVNASMPSFNVIKGLNEQWFKPGNMSVGFKDHGKGAWGINVKVEDYIRGDGSSAVPIEVGKPLPKTSIIRIIGDAVAEVLDPTSGQFCHYACCPKCIAQPIKVEYAQPIVKCDDPECPLADGQCVCKAAVAPVCPQGKKMCQFAPLGSGSLCVDGNAHSSLCFTLGALCLKKGNVTACS